MITARVAELTAARVPFVHARVVLAERPTSAKAGDQAIVLPDGTIEGFVGGACAESTVRAQALALLDAKQSLLLRITPAPADGDGVTADGRLTVHNPCLSGGTLEIFLEPVLPAPLVLVVGDAPIGQALVELARPLGYAATVWNSGAIPDDVTAVVVASHGRDEHEVLTAALRAGVPYVGLVASRARGTAVVEALDVCGSMKGRIHTPAGLDIGARTPAEVALSILAEIVATRPRPTGTAHDPVASPTAEVATDPVCQMKVAMVETSLHLDHDGQRYWFCGSGCVKAFAANPGVYLPSLTT